MCLRCLLMREVANRAASIRVPHEAASLIYE